MIYKSRILILTLTSTISLIIASQPVAIYDLVLEGTQNPETQLIEFQVPQEVEAETDISRISYVKCFGTIMNAKLMVNYRLCSFLSEHTLTLKDKYILWSHDTANSTVIRTIGVENGELSLLSKNVDYSLANIFHTHVKIHSHQVDEKTRNSVLLKLEQLKERTFANNTLVEVVTMQNCEHHCITFISPSKENFALRVVIFKVSNSLFEYLRSPSIDA